MGQWLDFIGMPAPFQADLLAGFASMVIQARAGDWGEAERMAYEFRETQPFFK